MVVRRTALRYHARLWARKAIGGYSWLFQEGVELGGHVGVFLDGVILGGAGGAQGGGLVAGVFRGEGDALLGDGLEAEADPFELVEVGASHGVAGGGGGGGGLEFFGR